MITEKEMKVRKHNDNKKVLRSVKCLLSNEKKNQIWKRFDKRKVGMKYQIERYWKSE